MIRSVFMLATALLLVAFFEKCHPAASNAGAVASDSTSSDSAAIDGHPAWAMQGNIYEVNLRQYTPEGTFQAFEKSLGRLKEMGVQTLWFMPINPISKVDRKGLMGSYYAVADYVQTNPEFGTIDDWVQLVKHAHSMGFKVILDWVPNHSGADNRWLTAHPAFYVRDSDGKPAIPYDWTDTRKLDYGNQEMKDSMIASMLFWVTRSDIDGFRCDVAGDVPDSFWKTCIAQLKKQKSSLFFLAEADKPALHTDGFDATYAWSMFAMMKKVAAGERGADALDSIRQKVDTSFPPNELKMFFTSNHDENSWNKADYGTMPGAEHAPFAVFCETMPHDIPLIYSGQEEPVLDSISFFYKDPIRFKDFKRAPFYHTLLELRKNPALAANASFSKLALGDPSAIYSYTRQGGGKKILVILNLSRKEQTTRITDPALLGKATNVFAGVTEDVTSKPKKLAAWSYLIYAY
jgi:alpha-amylase